MKGSSFLFWFLVLLLPVVLALDNPTPTTDWHNSSPDDSHQKKSLANSWFKYPSGHWGRKFQYSWSTTLPPSSEPSLVRQNASFYLLSYLFGYYRLGRFSLMMGCFSFLGHFGHLAMVMVPIALVIAGLNLGALAHWIGNLFPLKWVPDTHTWFPETPKSTPGQNPLRTARPTGWEPNNPQLIDKVVTSPPGPKSLVVLKDSARKLPVQDAENFPEVPTPDTSGLLGEMCKFLHESYSKLPQSPWGGTEPKEAPNTQINKQKDLKPSHPKVASGKLPVPSTTLPSETPDANPPEPRKPNQVVKPGSVV
ncbi:hypothetical protein DSO57_1021430 [Entomophthora muscae]|uniref:Uncharacterized protein n=1 Tax=Entomophthora muscae TaxID=34485 RepID=A0ACC2U1A7_9FUNG|nr:hypothetical protein DSO57_1021430 [Entomophthora muscae]